VSERPIVIVTGASQGIGRELAIAFAEEGDVVALAARNEPNLEKTASLVTAAGGEPLVIPTDVTDVASVEAMAEAILGRFGRVDVLVNNSAVGGPSGRLWELDLHDWQDTFDVNITGVFLVTRAVLPSMLENGSGSVINIGSVSGKRPLFGRSPYTATKMALVGLTRTLALEAGPHGVRVNLISPGFVAGPRFDWLSAAQAKERGVDEDTVRSEFATQAALNRLTEARDVADAAVFLASDGARAITGADLNVNSGIVMY
jgi:NAD(P)-dependent dehydrogenase (short-subunit alcohol dehydrogenase family)